MIKFIKNYKLGFTLIEIIIALLILAIGLLGVLTLFPVGMDAVGKAGNIMVATFLAQGKLEDAKRLGYDEVYKIVTTEKTKFAPPYDNYEYEVLVTEDIHELELKQINVNVYWPAGGDPASQRFITLRTFLRKS